VPPGGDGDFFPDGVMVHEGEFDVVATSHRDLDVTDEAQVREVFTNVRPDVVVNLAAYTAVDRAESDEAHCRALNATAVGLLSDHAHAANARFMTLSTDYVFDGQKGSAYVESDETNPTSVYGKTKVEGELLCRPEDTIVRTSWVMGVRGKSVAHAIVNRARNGETVRFVNDQMGTVTNAADLSNALVALVRTTPGGLWHVANEGPATWFDVAEFIGAECGRFSDFAFAIQTSDLSPQPAATRPERSDLSSAKFASHFGRMPEWRDALTRFVKSVPA
jgi:dTDP-4-dehydrorhamnose reductase